MVYVSGWWRQRSAAGGEWRYERRRQAVGGAAGEAHQSPHDRDTSSVEPLRCKRLTSNTVYNDSSCCVTTIVSVTFLVYRFINFNLCFNNSVIASAEPDTRKWSFCVTINIGVPHFWRVLKRIPECRASVTKVELQRNSPSTDLHCLDMVKLGDQVIECLVAQRVNCISHSLFKFTILLLFRFALLEATGKLTSIFRLPILLVLSGPSVFWPFRVCCCSLRIISLSNILQRRSL